MRLLLSTYAPNILGDEVAATGLGIVVGDPDGVLRAIPGTLCSVLCALCPVPGNVAQVRVEMEDAPGQISLLEPRQPLERLLKRYKAKGLRPVVATELEFYITKPRNASEDAPQPPEFSPTAQNCDLDTCARLEPLLSEIDAPSKIQDLGVDTMSAEFGPGQFDTNFHHTDDVFASAKSALMFRRLVRGVAANHGYVATFMAKPYAAHPGNGFHVHASVLDRAGSIFLTAGRAR